MSIYIREREREGIDLRGVFGEERIELRVEDFHVISSIFLNDSSFNFGRRALTSFLLIFHAAVVVLCRQ